MLSKTIMMTSNNLINTLAMKLQKCLSMLFIITLLTASCGAGEPDGQSNQPPVVDEKEYLSEWQEGYLDIHQISTGRGNVAFMVMPDGTTLILDVGDIGASSNFNREIMPALPNLNKRPAQWIAQYAEHFSDKVAKSGKIDYVLLTHMDQDHIGSVSMAITSPGKDYKLSGVTHLAELLDFGTLVDRNYPDYNFPSGSTIFSDASVKNYLAYVNARTKAGGKVEGFSVGSKSQFTLAYEPAKYPTFEIRNIYANGTLWTGTGTAVEDIYLGQTVTSENNASTVIKLTYGQFKYFSGGDITSTNIWNNKLVDVEGLVGEKVGPVDVAVCNHHSCRDAMYGKFINATNPQAFIIPTWDSLHAEELPVGTMFEEGANAADRMIFSAGLVASTRAGLGTNGARIKPDGHIVTRVYPGGNEFQMFVLNDRNTEYEIIYKTDRLKSRD